MISFLTFCKKTSLLNSFLSWLAGVSQLLKSVTSFSLSFDGWGSLISIYIMLLSFGLHSNINFSIHSNIFFAITLGEKIVK